MRLTIKILLVSLMIAVASCKGKYDNEPIDSEDVLGYVNACTIFDTDNQDFLTYVNTHSRDADSTQIKGYPEVMRVLNSQGFIDVDYFMHVHEKLSPVVKVIQNHPDVERFPGIGISDLSFLEEGEKQYRKFLEDNTLSNEDKDFYRNQMAQIETTKLDLFYKQEKNKVWVSLVREESKDVTDADLQDVDIMQLTILVRDASGF